MQRREHRPHHHQPRQRFTLQAFSDVSSREEGTGDPEGGSIDGGLIKDYLLLRAEDGRDGSGGVPGDFNSRLI